MPTKGANELYLTQFLSPKQAKKVMNYFIRQETELYKRGGIRQRQRVASIERPVIFREWTNTTAALAYGTTLSVFNHNDDTINTVKTDFTADLTDAVRYGTDIYSCNGIYGDVIYKTTLPTLLYNTQTANFTAGLVITGGTSGATATIITDTDAGATGTLTLDNITGIFVTTETITDSSTGSAKANGALVFTNTAVITASGGTVPKCEALSIFDKSLVAIKTNNNESELLLTAQNDFTDWDTSVVTLGAAYSIIYAFAGKAKGSSNFQSNQGGNQSYGNVLVGFFESGYAGFERSSQDIGAVQTQIFPVMFEKLNDGGERNSLSFPKGIAFCNENGIFVLINNLNGERVELTRNIARSRKADFDFTGADIAWSSIDNRLYVTLRENAEINNLILWFDTQSFKEIIWGEIPFGVSSFFTKDKKLFGTASASPRVLEMFSEDQTDDEGAAIDYEYIQPMNEGSLETIKDWKQLDLGGDISNGAPVSVEVLGIKEEGGEIVETGISYTWTSAGGLSTESELGTAELAVDAFVATPSAGKPIWTPATGHKKAYGYNSYLLKISGSDKAKNIIRYATGTIAEKRNQRQNILT